MRLKSIGRHLRDVQISSRRPIDEMQEAVRKITDVASTIESPIP